jgi:hypothetical protein
LGGAERQPRVSYMRKWQHEFTRPLRYMPRSSRT